jgi:hypothetical protein
MQLVVDCESIKVIVHPAARQARATGGLRIPLSAFNYQTGVGKVRAMAGGP